jgi:hypothetical protein
MEFFAQFNPSETSRPSGLDLSFPQASLPVLYFPTMYERTRLVGDPESKPANEMSSDAAILEFPHTSASSAQGEQLSETAPSVAPETDNNPSGAPRTSKNSNDNTLPQSSLSSSPCNPRLWSLVSPRFAPITRHACATSDTNNNHARTQPSLNWFWKDQ